MLTSLKLALAAATAAATGGYAMQGMLGDDQPAAPKTDGFEWKLAGQDDKTYSYQAQDSRLDKKVSVNIDGNVADVVKWLTSQGISFAISDATLGQKKIMINMVDQPLRDVVQAIGEALGGTWAKSGNVYAFKPGHQMFFNMNDVPMGDMKAFKWDGKDLKGLENLKELEALKNLPKFMPKMDGKAFSFQLPEGGQHKMTDAEKKAFEKSMKEAQIEMKKAGEAMKKAFEGQDWKSFQGHELSAKEKLEIERAMKQAQDEMKKAFEGKDWKSVEGRELSAKEKLEVEKAMKQAHEEMKKAFDGKAFKEIKDFKGMTPKEKAELEKELSNLHKDLKKTFDGKEWKELENFKGKGFFMNDANFSELLRSLTPAQKEKHKKQGYLNLSDLTPAQRKMLGSSGNEGSFTISFSKDGEKVTIKGGK